MNLMKLEEYLDYKPVFDKNPQYLVDEIILLASKYIKEKEKLLEIQKAYEFARDAHNNSENNLRHSGEPYIVHPVMATKFLMKIRPGIASIQAALLHDVIEDTNYGYNDIKNNFGDEVADICSHLEKVSKIKYKNSQNKESKNTAGEIRNLETLKKTFLAMGKDLRVIFIKLADRIHNIQTLKYHPKQEKIQRIAIETLKIYVPIAQRLGLSVFQGYLENGSFKILYEKEFNKILNYLKRKYGYGTKHSPKGVKMLEDILKIEDNIKYLEIKGRIKSPYRIFKKLQKYQTNDVDKILDIIAFRIITDSISNCYNILGIIHKNYTPIIKKIKDYISIPKQNGYSSLHTTILGMFHFPVEIQIRTKEMDKVAEYGVAAHYSYVETGSDKNVSESQAEWIKRMQDVVKTFQKVDEEVKENFKNELEIEILEKNIFVYTPAGDIKELPQGSTVLDFAFRIHSDIGLNFRTAIINNQNVPIDYKLNNGDIVKINSFKNKTTASSSWLKYLHTPSAKAKLNKFLRAQEKEIFLLNGTNLLNKKLKEYNLPLIGTKKDLISKKYKGEDFIKIMIKILDKQINPTKLIKSIYGEKAIESFFNNKNTGEEIKYENIKNIIENIVIIDYDKKLDYNLCPECNPIPGDKIIGKAGKDGIKIHTLKCSALKVLSYKKLLEAHWKGQNSEKYILNLILFLIDSPGILLKVLTIFSTLNVNINSINVDKSQTDGNTKVIIELQFYNPSKIDFILKELKNKENYVKILKREII